MVEHALQQRQTLMLSGITSTVDVTLVITGRNRGMVDLVDLVITLIYPLDHIFIPQHTHTPEQVNKAFGPRCTLHAALAPPPRAPHIEGLALAYAHTRTLEVPDRLINAEILRPLLKACREHLRLEVEYVSLANPEPEVRLIAPHTLIYTGMRWHVRAFCEENQAYRDFVLSRLRGVPEFMDDVTETVSTEMTNGTPRYPC